MKINSKNDLLILLLVALSFGLYGQISSVKYQLRFNAKSNLYECYIFADKGSAKAFQDRAQFNTQIGLVVPKGTKITIAENHNPIQNNRDLKGTKPMPWTISSEIFAPVSAPENDFIGIAPSLNPVSFYNEIKEGEYIKIISFRANPIPLCKSSIRLFDNDTDPISEQLMGGDFRNGFTIGGIDQKYTGNVESIYEGEPSGQIGPIAPVKLNGTIKLNAGSWDNAKSYKWTGPNGFTSNQKNPSIKNATEFHSGKYVLTVQNKVGCTSQASVMVNVGGYRETLMESENNINVVLNNRSDITTSIYPNPASDSFSISINAEKGLEVNADIMDGAGKILKKSVVSGFTSGEIFESKIAVGNLDTGVYIVAIKVGEKVQNHKLIVVK